MEQKIEILGEKLKGLTKAQNDTKFIDGFVTSSLVICIGAMAVVGAINDGLNGDASMLFAKSILDFIIVMIFAATFGIGVMFSAVPLGIYEGLITLCAVFIAPYLSDILIV